MHKITSTKRKEKQRWNFKDLENKVKLFNTPNKQKPTNMPLTEKTRVNCIVIGILSLIVGSVVLATVLAVTLSGSSSSSQPTIPDSNSMPNITARMIDH